MKYAAEPKGACMAQQSTCVVTSSRVLFLAFVLMTLPASAVAGTGPYRWNHSLPAVSCMPADEASVLHYFVNYSHADNMWGAITANPHSGRHRLVVECPIRMYPHGDLMYLTGQVWSKLSVQVYDGNPVESVRCQPCVVAYGYRYCAAEMSTSDVFTGTANLVWPSFYIHRTWSQMGFPRAFMRCSLPQYYEVGIPGISKIMSYSTDFQAFSWF